VKQVAVVYEAGEGLETELLRFIQSAYRPNTIIAATAYPPSNESSALLMDRPLKNGQPTIYVCRLCLQESCHSNSRIGKIIIKLAHG